MVDTIPHSHPAAERSGRTVTKEGLDAARKRGRIGGRPPALSAAQWVEVRRMRAEELRPLPEIAQLFRVSFKTIRRA